jgi:hypothetical protein
MKKTMNKIFMMTIVALRNRTTSQRAAGAHLYFQNHRKID